MGHWFWRVFRAKAKVCWFVALWLVWTRSANARPFELPASDGAPGVVVYPAESAGPHRITVVLHGMCGHAENICRIFASEATAGEHLICPRATSQCEGGGASWSQKGFAESIEQAVQR